jgi:hypothetical protein
MAVHPGREIVGAPLFIYWQWRVAQSGIAP